MSKLNKTFCFYSEKFKEFLNESKDLTKGKTKKLIEKLISIEGSNIETMDFKATFINFGDKDNMVSYISPTKIVKLYKEGDDFDMEFEDWVEKMRKDNFFNSVKATQAKIGRFLSQMLKKDDIEDKIIEQFVNIYKSYHTKQSFQLQIVYGDDILKYYNTSTHLIQNGYGSLSGSCMNYHIADYENDHSIVNSLKFYSLNPNVGLLILKCPVSDKIKGRALIWTLKNGKKYIDIPYVENESDFQLYSQYAITNKCLSEWEYDYDDMEVLSTPEISNLFSYASGKRKYILPYLDTFGYDAASNRITV